MHRIVTIFCKYMNHNVTYPVLSKSVTVEGVFFVSNTAYAYSICKSVDNKLVVRHHLMKSTFYGPNSVICETRNSPTIPSG
jgi:hypothetical protein